MPELTVLVNSVALVGAAFGALLVARRYRQLGGGTAQDDLNKTYLELNTAFKAQIIELTLENASLKAERLEARRERLRREQDLDDLREEVRQLKARVRELENGNHP